jgi:hypothetical protein
MLNCHIFSSLVQVIMIATFGVLQVCFANYHPTSCLRRHGSRCHDHGMTPSVIVVLYEILRNDNEFRMVSMMEEEVSVWINGVETCGFTHSCISACCFIHSRNNVELIHKK